MARGDFDEGADGVAGAAGVEPGFAGFEEGGTGNVEVDPGFAGDEFFQKLGGGDRAAPAAFADVFDIGHFAFDLLAEFGKHGKFPDLFAGNAGGGFDGLGPGLVVSHQAGDVAAEGDEASTGECGEVDDAGGVVLKGDVEDVGENEAAFGVGVENFDRFAAASGKHVAQFVGIAAEHVFDEAAEADHVNGELEAGDGLHRAEHGGRAGHVAFHRFHAVG